jgi:hypothetical protein
MVPYNGTNVNFKEPSMPSRHTSLVKKRMVAYQETCA